MKGRMSLLVTAILGLIKFLTAVQEGIAWLVSKRYRGQVIRGMEGEVFRHEFLNHMDRMMDAWEFDPDFDVDDPMNDPSSWGEWQMRYDPDSREDR